MIEDCRIAQTQRDTEMGVLAGLIQGQARELQASRTGSDEDWLTRTGLEDESIVGK